MTLRSSLFLPGACILLTRAPLIVRWDILMSFWMIVFHFPNIPTQVTEWEESILASGDRNKKYH